MFIDNDAIQKVGSSNPIIWYLSYWHLSKSFLLFLFNGSSSRPCGLQGLEDGGSCGIEVASGRSVWTPWRSKVSSGMFLMRTDTNVYIHSFGKTWLEFWVLLVLMFGCRGLECSQVGQAANDLNIYMDYITWLNESLGKPCDVTEPFTLIFSKRFYVFSS